MHLKSPKNSGGSGSASRPPPPKKDITFEISFKNRNFFQYGACTCQKTI
eukprot:UN21390